MKLIKRIFVLLLLTVWMGMGTAIVSMAIPISEIKENSSPVETTPIEDTYLSGETPQKEGYEFVGWTVDSRLDYSKIAAQYEKEELKNWNKANLMMEDDQGRVPASDAYDAAEKLRLVNPEGEAEEVKMIAVFLKIPDITFDPIINTKDYFFYEDEQNITLDVLKWGITVEDIYDGDSLTVNIDSIKYNVGTTKEKVVTSPLKLDTQKTNIGKCEMKVSVTNSRGGKAEKTITFEIKENKAPVIELLELEDGNKAYYYLDEVKDISCLKGEEGENNTFRDLIYENFYLKDEVEGEAELLHNFSYILPEDFKPLEMDRNEKQKEYVIKLQVKDQYGHRFYMNTGEKKQYGLGKETKSEIKLIIVNTAAYKREKGYVRFIREDTLDTLLPNSKWRSDKCKEILDDTFSRDPKNEDDCENIWEFSVEDMNAIQDQLEENGWNPYQDEADEAFKEKYTSCKIK